MPDNFEESSENEAQVSFFKSLPKPQRAVFLLLSALSLGVIILWVWQFNSRLSSPFYIAGSEQNNDIEAIDFTALLANVDTDGDGLTDNEEQSLYNTSPYLADSDSDGISDRIEIEKGTDPNCALGEQCNVQDVPAPVTPALIATSTITTTPASDLNSSKEDSLQLMMAGQADAAQLRALLISSGADANMLQQLSDEELLKTYQEMLAGQAGE